MRKHLTLSLVALLSSTGLAFADGAQEQRPAPAAPRTSAARTSGMGDNPVGGRTDHRAGMPPRAQQLRGPASTAVAGPMRFYAVSRLDPLTGSTMDSPGSPDTPTMAGSTGAWTRPPDGSPQSEWKTRATGVELHDQR